jgi:4-hydroxy-3-polyprenylbenzoate decarboxylase
MGELKRIARRGRPHLEMTEICDRVLRAGGPGPAVREAEGARHAGAGQPVRHAASAWRWAWARKSRRCARIGKLLAYLKEPEPPKGLRDAWDKLPVLKQVLNMAPKKCRRRLPGDGVGRQGRRPVAPADPDLLAGRRRRR